MSMPELRDDFIPLHCVIDFASHFQEYKLNDKRAHNHGLKHGLQALLPICQLSPFD